MSVTMAIRHLTTKLLATCHQAHKSRSIGQKASISTSWTSYQQNVKEASQLTNKTSGNQSAQDSKLNDSESKVNITFIRPDGSKVAVKTKEGKSLYDAVIDNNVDIDGFGACEGTLCCTTCHLILKQSDYDKIGEPRNEELDMLDLAYGLTDTSRLGCQVILKKDYDPLEVQVPLSMNDVRES